MNFNNLRTVKSIIFLTKGKFLSHSLSLFLSFFLANILMSCEPLEVDPPNYELTSDLVFNDDATAEAAILGLYSNMVADNGFASGGYQSVTVLSGLAGDEFTSNTGTVEFNEFWNNSILPTNSWVQYSLWNTGYTRIYHSNSILEGLDNSPTISEPLKNQLEGEARFLRAFFYFYLVNMFGDIPLVLETDYNENKTAPRESVDKVYEQIINDLSISQDLLTDDYGFSSNERIRVNKWAAKALLARVYLFQGEWSKAESESTDIIDQEGLFKLEPHDKVFLKDSKEAIWQLFPVASGYNTREGATFLPLGANPNFISLTESLVEAFEEGDQRKENWIGELHTSERTHFYPSKYKVRWGSDLLEYSMVFRLAEQYLIRAEARAEQEKIDPALLDLNVLRERSGLEEITEMEKGALLQVIYHERRTELFSEWGHRWFDLKRTGRADEILSPIKPHWTPQMSLFPIPQVELQNNPNMYQNPGY